MKNMHYTKKGPGRVHRTKPLRVEVPEGGFQNIEEEWEARERIGAITQTFERKYVNAFWGKK